MILNFLVRIVLSNAESKDDGAQDVCRRGIALFKRGVRAWKFDVLRSVYFDKALSGHSDKQINLKENESSVVSKAPSGSSDEVPQNPSSNKSKNALSTESLVACLELMIALIKYSPHLRFWEENIHRLCNFIITCFSRATLSKNGLLRIQLKCFLVAVFREGNIPSSMLLQSRFVNVIKGQMESILVSGGKGQEKMESSNGSDVNQKNNAEDHDPFDDVRCGGRFPGFFVVEIIHDVFKNNPRFLDNFISPLIGLGQRLVKGHVQEVATATRRVTSMNSQMISRGVQQCLATPMLGIIEEATDLSSGAISAVNDIVLSDDRGMKEIEDIGTCIRSTIMIVRLLGSQSKLSNLLSSDLRKRYFQLLSTVLDKSDCVSLLLTVVGIVGKWLVNPRSPITKSERIRFLKKLTFNQLTEVPAEPLASLVANIILTMKNTFPKRIAHVRRKRDHEEINESSFPSPSNISTAVVSDDDTSPLESDICVVVDQLAMSYSLTADNERRLKLMQSLNDQHDPKIAPTEYFLTDVLLEILHTDIEGLGEKLWLQGVVERMIESCSNDRKISVSAGSPIKEKCSSGLPVCCNENSSDEIGISKIPSYLEFYKELRSLTNSHKYDCLSYLRCIGNLAIGDADLCQHLFRNFVKAAWASDKREGTRRLIMEALEMLLAHPQHAQFVYTSRFPFNPKYDSNTLLSSHGFNIIQGVVSAILDLQPTPEMDVDLLVHIATNFNAWHQVIRILESNLRTCSDSDTKSRIKIALRRCFSAIGEDDISLSISMHSSTLSGTKQALSFELYGMVTEALTSYNAMIGSVTENTPASEEVDIWVRINI